MDKFWIVCLVILGAGCLWSVKSAVDNREVIAGILSHTLNVYRVRLKVLEENCRRCKVKVDGWESGTINCGDGWTFPVSPYFREFDSDEVTLVRVKQNGHAYFDESSHWRIDWGCKFIYFISSYSHVLYPVIKYNQSCPINDTLLQNHYISWNRWKTSAPGAIIRKNTEGS